MFNFGKHKNSYEEISEVFEMTKDVIVKIRGLQNGPETDGEPIEKIVAGEYFYKNNKPMLSAYSRGFNYAITF